MNKIPIYKPYLSKEERDIVLDCVESTWISSRGAYIDKFEGSVKDYTKAKFCTTTSSGTSALHLAMLALDIKKGDEIITTNFTYVASVNSILYVGAKPVFCEINENDLNINVNDLEKKITSRTKAILYTNVYGYLCDFDKLKNVASKHGLYLIEDAAESFGAVYKGKMSGTLGDVSTFSFFGNKTITTGEGGMVLCKKEEHFNKIKQLKNQGNSDKTYFHDVLGYNYRMTNIQAAIGLAQLNKIEKIISLKKSIFDCYYKLLNKKVNFLKKLENTHPSYWMIPIIFATKEQKQKAELVLLNNNIETRPFFTPIDNLPFYNKSNCILAKKIFELGLLLPSYPGLSKENQIKICKLINSTI
jgi:perosamine synthetase